MSLKTHSKGAPFPPLKDGTLRLYSMRFCPYAQRTRLVLAHKEIPNLGHSKFQHSSFSLVGVNGSVVISIYGKVTRSPDRPIDWFETINVDLKEKPEWFLERNPKGLVPTLEQDGKIIYESLITCDYLDEVYPNNHLTPSDPYQKARDAILIDFFSNKFIPNYYKVFRSEGKDEEGIEGIASSVKKLDEELTARGKYFGGDQLAMIDFMLWPWFERFSLISQKVPTLTLSDNSNPKLYAWIKVMMQQPAVKETYFDPETHSKFYQLYLEGNRQAYDIGLDP